MINVELFISRGEFMFDINIDLNDVSISSIERDDIVFIQKWINEQNSSNAGSEKPLGLKEIYERFLEYYVSEGEFFLKITKKEKLIGVLKGRIEFKTINEVWFWYFLLDNQYRELGIGSDIIKNVKDYFMNELGIYDFYTGVCEKDLRILKFWSKNKFAITRISKGYFNINNEDLDMIVLKNCPKAD